MLASLVQAFNGSGEAEQSHAVASSAPTSPFANNFTSSDYQRLQQKDPDQFKEDKPKAYLNFVLFDDQFNLVDENSGVKQVQGEPDQLQTLAKDQMVMQQSGFLYVYTSNESPQDVFFDNVTVAQINGPLLEETHYYPFGLTMDAISSNVLRGTNYPENRKKYNGIEFTNELDLNIYDAQLRNLDPQIGRWNQVDPKTENMEMWSPYVSNYNNPIRFNDFLGDEPDEGGPGLLDQLRQAASQTVQQVGSFGLGVANAFVSNNVAGIGRVDVESSGLFDKNALAYQLGQKVGDAGSIISGALEDIGSGASVVLSGGQQPLWQ